MHTLFGWSESVAGAVATQLLLAIPDNHVYAVNDDIIVPQLNKLIGYYGIGTDIQAVQLDSPSLRRSILLDVAPVENVNLPVAPPDLIVRPDSPLELEIDEQINAHAGNSNVGAQQETVLALLSDRAVSPVSGKIYTIRATVIASTLTYEWESIPIVLGQNLPVGKYDIVGARLEKANGIAFRFNFVGGAWRPGTIAVNTIDGQDIPFSRYGKLGVWGSFSHNTPPTVEILAQAVGGTSVLYIDLIKR